MAMATMRLFQYRTSRRVTMIHVRGGESREIPRAPSEFTSNGGHRIETIPRQGRKPLTRPDGPELREISFRIKVGSGQYDDRAAHVLTHWLRRIYNEGRQIRFTNMQGHFAGWWHITAMPIEVTRLNAYNHVTLAEIQFTCQEVEDFTGRVTRYPPPPPKRPAGRPASTPSYRWHTVVSGDWLSKIAQRYLGNMNRWREIYRLNRDQISNPDLIYPGQRLKLPPR